MCVAARNFFALDSIEEWALRDGLLEAAQRQRMKLKVERNGVTDLAWAVGMVPIWHVSPIGVAADP